MNRRFGPTLSKITPEERSLFLLLDDASNQVNLLWKLAPLANGYPKVTRVAVFSHLSLK
jgi:hypothetical protein